jgi:hypothetical protein
MWNYMIDDGRGDGNAFVSLIGINAEGVKG